MYSGNWKEWIIKQRQEYLVRLRSGHLIKEKESLYLLYPMTQELHLENYLPEMIQMFTLAEKEKIKKNGSHKEQLNPRWVEMLMGVPIGWTMATCANPYVIERTNSDFLVTESSQQQRKEPSESYGKPWATPTTSQLERNESLDSYLRRSKKRILKGQKPFPVQLTFEVEAEEKGINIKKELNKKSSKLDK
jgi:hypothetical protein